MEPPEIEVRPASAAEIDALIEGDDAFTELTGLRVAPDYLDFPEALERTRVTLADGGEPRWESHLFVEPARRLVIGFGGFKGEPVDGWVEIGYSLAPTWRGRGYATAAVGSLLDAAVRAGVEAVIAHTLPEPNASTRVLERCGFRFTQTVEHPSHGTTWRWSRSWPGTRRVKRVGHKGADLIAPGNTLASFGAALEAGVDMIEFDVLALPGGEIVIAHDFEDAARREPLTLGRCLDVLGAPPFDDIELDVDLKLPGYEREVVENLEARGLSERSLISSAYAESLAALGELAPGVRRGWSVPRARRDYTRNLLAPAAYAVLALMRRRLPARAAAAVRTGRCEAIMTHWRLVGAPLVDSVHTAGGEVYVWTVDDRDRIARLERLEVDGVITNDPRLFDPPAGTRVPRGVPVAPWPERDGSSPAP